LMEPWTANVLARRMAGEALPAISTELFVITCLFSILVFASLYACARLVRAFRLPPLTRTISVAADHGRTGVPANNASSAELLTVRQSERSRATAIATLLASNGRRERGELRGLLPVGPATSKRIEVLSSSAPLHVPTPVGRTFTRRPHSRLSAVAARRDTGA
jgi:hypothetical protein